MLRKAGNAPGHKPVVVNFACVFAFVSVFVSVVAVLFVCYLVGCGWLLLVVVGCLLVVCCLCVVYLLFICCLFVVVVVVFFFWLLLLLLLSLALLVFLWVVQRAHACHRAPQKCFLSGVMVLFFLLVGCISLWLHARDRIHS